MQSALNCNIGKFETGLLFCMAYADTTTQQPPTLEHGSDPLLVGLPKQQWNCRLVSTKRLIQWQEKNNLDKKLRCPHDGIPFIAKQDAALHFYHSTGKPTESSM
jgi:hypothetical protein